MPNQQAEQPLDRRGFLRAAAATAVAATAAGAGAALVLEPGQPQSAGAFPSPVIEPIKLSSNPVDDLPDILSRLAASQAENVRLQAQLGIAMQQLEAARSSPALVNNSESEALKLQLEDANSQVGILSGKVSVLGGLLTLYEQLDAVDLAGVVGGGMTSVGGVLGNLMEDVPSINEGLAAGQQALAEFEEEIPLVEEGRRWMDGQIHKISAAHLAVEVGLRNALQATGTFLQLINEWFQSILKWLPFGIGDTAAGIVESISTLLADLPETLSGFQTHVAQPLDMWLEKEGDQPRLQRRLVKPLRDEALGRATTAISKTQILDSTYQTYLVQPFNATTSQQQAVRNMIIQYRQEHQI
jgi:hypothetical protein